MGPGGCRFESCRPDVDKPEYTVFWDDLAEDLKDPEFRSAYETASIRIATSDHLIDAELEDDSDD